MSFESLGLEPELLRAVAAKGYTTPTPIQSAAIPAVLAGHDVLAGAQTGTGKTAGFVLPLLQLLDAPRGRAPRVLVLTPTRELAAQIADSVEDYGAHKKLRCRVIFGGVGERPQIDGLRAGCDVLIATPGRLIDLCEQRHCDLGSVQHFVLDEADRMLDMGFIHAIRRIIRMLPRERQNLMFSATYSEEIRALAAGMLKDPVSVEVAPRNTTAERVEQIAFKVVKEDKRHLLVHLFRNGAAGEGPWSQALVFTRTKHGANRLTEQLQASGIRAAAIHGNKSQSARVKALSEFREGSITALVATEVASRGLDIKELPQVVNYELPNVPEDYVHRIGRTARAGSTGAAVSLVAPDETSLLRNIERTMNQRVPFAPLPAFEVVETRAPAAPRRQAVAPDRQRAAKPSDGRAAQGGGRRDAGPGSAGRTSASAPGARASGGRTPRRAAYVR
ncbi:MAG: DEAD/DEAH box helicase [Pseudomonadales bacterium]|nr:DEAD/DEAH box helicase [Pseudomonadales bacterium]